MANGYHVVFELNATNGYAYGIRTRTTYRSEAEFNSLTAQNNFQTAIAKGITDEESERLTSQTPEICRIAAAIESAKQDSGDDPNHINHNLLNHHLTMALFAIQLDRRYRLENNMFDYPDATPYIDAYRAAATSDSTLDTLIRFALEYCIEFTGAVRLDQYPNLLGGLLLIAL